MAKDYSVEARIVDGDAVIACFQNSGKISNVDLEVYDNKKKNAIVHGESSDKTLQYDGDELEDSQYLLGVYDPKNKEIKLVQSKMFSGRVKSNSTLMKDAKLMKKLKRSTVEGTYAERRNALGEEFGTKKAKKAITEAAKNKIDAGLLEGSQVDIIDGIRETTKSMPNREQMAKLVEKENRVIPPCYPEATNVEDIYPIEEIVYSEILDSFPIDIFFSEESVDIINKIKLLPYVLGKDRGDIHLKNSIFGKLLDELLNSTQTEVSEDVKYKLKLVSFTSMLVGLYFNRRCSRREKLMESFTNLPPSRAINFMLQNFGNTKVKNSNFDRDIKFFNIGPKEEDKLLCYIIVLLLSLFDYRLELSSLAADLSLKPSRLLALVRTLGCSIMIANKSDGKENSGNKMAVLRVPFKVPELVRRFKR